MTWQEAYSVKHLTVSTNNDLTPVNSEKCNVFFTRWKLTKSIIPKYIECFLIKRIWRLPKDCTADDILYANVLFFGMYYVGHGHWL